MNDSNVLNVILRFLVDKNSQAQANQAIAAIGSGTAGTGSAVLPNIGIGKEVVQFSKDFQVSIAEAAKSMQGMSLSAGRTEQQLLADAQAFQTMSSEADKTALAVDRIDKTAQRYGGTMKTGFVGFVAMMAGMQMQRAGQAILSPIDAYVKAAGAGEIVSARWLNNQNKIQNSFVKIGRVMTDQLEPVLETAANAVDSLATFAEQNPGLVAAAGSIGLTMAVGGRLVMMVGGVISSLSALKGLQALTGAGSGTAAGVGIAAVLKGALPYMAAGIGATILASYIGKDSAERYRTRLANGEPTGAIGLPGGTTRAQALKAMYGTQGAGAALITPSNEQMQALAKVYTEYERQMTDAEKSYQETRKKLIDDYNQAQLEAEQSHQADEMQALRDFTQEQKRADQDNQRQRVQALRDFSQQMRQAEEDYYRQRAIAARDYGIEVQRAEEDHQRRMEEIRRQHETALEDTIAAGDARAWFKEMASYETQRQTAESDYQVEAARRSEDFARLLADREQEFQITRSRRVQEFAQAQTDRAAEFEVERARRVAEFEQTQKDRDSEYAIERQRSAAEHAKKLSELAYQYADERQQRLTQLHQAFMDELNLRDQFNTAVMQRVQAMINAIQQGQTGKGSRAAGGYVDYGYYLLNAQTTDKFERMTRSRLTQGNVIDAMQGLAVLKGSVSNYNNFRFDGRISAEDRRWIQASIDKTLENILT